MTNELKLKVVQEKIDDLKRVRDSIEEYRDSIKNINLADYSEKVNRVISKLSAFSEPLLGSALFEINREILELLTERVELQKLLEK